jgi:hypothetical protein
MTANGVVNVSCCKQGKARFQNPEGLETRVGDDVLIEKVKTSQLAAITV